MPTNDCTSFLCFGGYFIMHIHFPGVWLCIISGYYFFKERNPHPPEISFILYNLRFAHLHIHITCLSIVSWLLSLSLYPTMRMSSAMPNTLGKSLNIPSIFTETCSFPMLQQIVFWHICTYQTDKQTLLDMIFV